MTSSPIRQKAFATPRDEEDAVQLLNASVDPVLARVKNDVMACRNAVANGQTVLISEQRGIPEEVVLALGHHGDAFLGALRINMRDEIAKLKDSRYVMNVAVGTQSKLELVGHQRINEDLAAAALVHRLHFELQNQAQAQAVRISRIWPKAYITETDVPTSAEFQVRHILNALRSIDRDFMTSEARVMILSEMVRNWLGVLNDCLKKANSELSNRGWLPDLNKQDIISWKRHINRMAGVNDATYWDEKKQSTPQADVETEFQPTQPEPYASARPVSNVSVASERVDQQPQRTSSISPIRRPESFNALEYARPDNSFTRNQHAQFQPSSSLHAEYNDSTPVTEWAEAFTGPSSVEIGQRFQRAIQSSLLPLPQQEINFAEPLLSHLQVVIKDYEKPVLLDTASIVKKEAVRRGADDVSDALVQRLVAAQNMMRTLMADESIPGEVKIILVKLQLPWTRYLLQSGDALANAADPFKDLLWSVCAIGRRSSAPENDGTAQMLRATIAYFDKATRIDESVIQKALNFINLKWDDICRKAKLVLSRAALSWQGSASIMEKRQSVKDEIASLIGEDNVPESFAAAISENIIPMLLLYGLKEHLSEHDQRRAQHARVWAQHYIRLRLKTPLNEIIQSELESVYRKCLELVQDAVGNNSRLEADQAKFLELLAASGEQAAPPEVVATAPAPTPESKIALATVIEPELPLSTDQPPCTLDFMEKAKSMAIGSWLIANYEGHAWRGRIAARIKFKDSVIISDRNGGKLAEMTHQEFGHHLEKGHIKLIEDASSFSRALESMVMSVRQYNAV